MLVFDEGLAQATVPFDDVDKVVDDAIFESQHNIEVAQTDISINDDDFFAEHCQSGAQIGGRRGFADSAFARGNGNDFRHDACSRLCLCVD